MEPTFEELLAERGVSFGVGEVLDMAGRVILAATIPQPLYRPEEEAKWVRVLGSLLEAVEPVFAPVADSYINPAESLPEAIGGITGASYAEQAMKIGRFVYYAATCAPFTRRELIERFPIAELSVLKARVRREAARLAAGGGNGPSSAPAAPGGPVERNSKVRRGRKPKHDPARDAELLAAWGRAQAARVSREQFCDERLIGILTLEQAQARERYRQKRAQ